MTKARLKVAEKREQRAMHKGKNGDTRSEDGRRGG
jgi:hypothetical protein